MSRPPPPPPPPPRWRWPWQSRSPPQPPPNSRYAHLPRYGPANPPPPPPRYGNGANNRIAADLAAATAAFRRGSPPPPPPGPPPIPSNLRATLHPAASVNSANIATIKNNLDTFVTRGGDINKQTGDDNDTYLMIYLNTARYNIAKAIAEHPSTDVNIKNNHADTALHKAVENDNLSIVNILISRGADINAKNEDRDTPLHLAANNEGPNFRSIIESLLTAGADKSLENDDEFTPYIIAELHDANDSLLDLLRVEGGPTLNNRVRTHIQQRGDQGNNSSINLLNTIERRRNPYPRKSKNRYIVIKPPSTIDVYDFGEVGEVKVTYQDTLEDRENIYFKASNNFFRLPRISLQNSIDDHSGIQYECKKELLSAPTRDNVVLTKPYFLIRGLANFLVPLDEVLGMLHATEENSYELKDAEREPLNYVSSYKSIIRDYSGIGLNGQEVNIMSADHCQEGSTRKLYKLIPFYFIDAEQANYPSNTNSGSNTNSDSNNNASNNNAPTTGGRRRKRATKKLKRSKSSTRRRSKR